MIDIKELRQSLGAVQPEEVAELLDRLEAAEKSDAESLAMYRKARDERDAYKTAFEEWHQKTGWVQQGINDGSIPPTYLGWHRADVMADMLKSARRDYCVLEGYYTELAEKLEAAEKERNALRAKIEAMELECDAMRTMIQVALEVLENVRGNINPERGYADELEVDIKHAITTITSLAQRKTP